MSAVFYNKYRSLFFDDKDPEPLSLNYFNTKPKNYLNIVPNSNFPSLAQHFEIIPKDLDLNRGRIEEIPKILQYKAPLPQRLEPLAYKPPLLPTFENKPKIPSIEYVPEQPQLVRESPKRAQSTHKLPPITYEHTKSNIFPEKTEIVKVGNTLQEAMKRRKEAKNKVNERRQRLREILSIDKVI